MAGKRSPFSLTKFSLTRCSLTRRAVLGGAALLPVLPCLGFAASKFPAGFTWGVSTSAAQIEGAAESDGKAPSIWDIFAKQPGRIADGGTPEVACDHYHRAAEDIALMQGLGIGAYRFSIAWSRVMPDGTGRQNRKGWDFYDRLADGLLEAGIRPMPCLYHWDLPQALQEKGGWLSRDSAAWLAEYALAALNRLGDRVDHWFILNEASVHAVFGHGTGEHAPGVAGGNAAVLQALHHQNLAQGTALRALRQARSDLTLGTILSLQPVVPDSESKQDHDAAIRWDAVWNRLALDSLMRGTVPEILARDLGKVVQPDDLDLVKTPIDVLGMNYYSRFTVRHQPGRLFDVGWGKPRADRFTAYGWPVEPQGLKEMLLQLKTLYGNPPVLITENGAAYADVPSDGTVEDDARIAFLREHLLALEAAIGEGCNVKGYMAWSLLDNFEWQMGYKMRFGLVFVDFANGLKRVPKASSAWFRTVAGTGNPA
jgi:beta-glucosidase